MDDDIGTAKPVPVDPDGEIYDGRDWLSDAYISTIKGWHHIYQPNPRKE